MEKENYYWFSISTGGENKGVFQTKAVSRATAMGKFEAATENIKKENVMCAELEKKEEEVELDRLYTKEEMRELGYTSTKEQE